MSLVRFPGDPILLPPENSVEDSDLLNFALVRTQNLCLELEVLAQGLVEPHQIDLSGFADEVVSMHNHLDVPRGVVEAARRTLSLDKPENLSEDARVLVGPIRCRVTCSVK